MPASIDKTAQGDAASSAEPSADAVRAQLARILDSTVLQGSQRRRELLSYLVGETLAGRGEAIKGYRVALAVFGRDETFDPSTDPVVRLEAGRLRRSLDSYYVDSGEHDAVRITIPKGAYVAQFAWQNRGASALAEGGVVIEPQPPARSIPAMPGGNGAFRIGRLVLGSRKWAATLLLAALLALPGLSWLWLRNDVPDVTHARIPALIVLPFRTLGDGDRFLAEGLSQELITDLMRFSAFRLYSAAASFRQSPDASPVELGHGLGVSYVVSGSVRSDTRTVRISAQLVDAESGRIIWSETYARDLTPGALLGVQSELAGSIASTLGQPYGIVQSDVADRLQGSAVPSMPSYECVLRAYTYRRTFSPDLGASSLDCLEEAVARDPTYAAAWALLAWLRLDTARFEVPAVEDMTVALGPALEAAQRAATIDPKSVVALQALAAINYYLGRFDESERVYHAALALNPHDPETLAQLGWRLVVRGKADEGVGYGQRAIDRSVSPPGWYFHYIAIDCLMRGDYAGMLANAERATVDGSAMSQSLIAIAQGELGNKAAAHAALRRMAKIAPALARDPAASYRVHHPVDSILTALVDGLHKAGLQELAAPAMP